MKIRAEQGANIFSAAQSAILAAKGSNQTVELIFNDISVEVRPLSLAEDIATIYCLKRELRRQSFF